jgi:hypothetical protein
MKTLNFLIFDDNSQSKWTGEVKKEKYIRHLIGVHHPNKGLVKSLFLMKEGIKLGGKPLINLKFK